MDEEQLKQIYKVITKYRLDNLEFKRRYKKTGDIKEAISHVIKTASSNSSIDVSGAISDLGSDELAIYVMEKCKENLRILDIGSIILRLNSDQKKVEILEQWQEKIDNYDLGTIIASLKSDDLKLNIFEKAKNQLLTINIVEIIKSFNSDSIKITMLEEWMDKLEHRTVVEIVKSINSDESKLEFIKKYQDKSGTDAIGFIIPTLKEDEIKIEALETLQDKMSDKSIVEIIISINSDELKLSALEQWQDKISDYDIGDIIKSLKSDVKKLELMNSWKEALKKSGYHIGMIIESFDSDEIKINLLRSMKEEIWQSGYPISLIISGLKSDDLKLNAIEEFKDVLLAGDISNIIEGFNSNEAKLVVLGQWQEELYSETIRTEITKLSLLDKKVISLELDKSNKKGETIIPLSVLIGEQAKATFKECDFKYFNAEMPEYILDELLEMPKEEWRDFLKFAKALGCFSDEEILDKKGSPTGIKLGQKATTTLRDFLKTEWLELGEFHEMFDSIPMHIKPNQDFLKFISKQEGKKSEKRFVNLELLIGLDGLYPGLFAKAMSDFDSVKELRESLDENGMPIRVSWEDALIKFYKSNKYVGVTEENRDIAETLASKGVGQDVFNKANELRKSAKAQDVPEHILGRTLKEESILASIERIREQTEEELGSGREIVEDLWSRKFTYEWLSKNDPANSIMGLFVDCCGTITSSAYGKNIARASVIAPDVQNIVIRESREDGKEGRIISKGTMYVNEKQGYAVINDFELNRKYRNHEYEVGRYRVDESNSEEQAREQIFQAYQRGLKAFIEEYDKQHPDNPLKQINIGWTYNRLKRQTERFKEATDNLEVPYEYRFEDARDRQFVLYERQEEVKQKEEDGGER